MHSSSQKQTECCSLISCLQVLCVNTEFEVDFFFRYSACIVKECSVTEAVAIIIVFLYRLALTVKSIFPTVKHDILKLYMN